MPAVTHAFTRRASALCLVSLILALTACDSGEKEGQTCPAGSNAVFVENGPNGPGCYCQLPLVPDATGAKCVEADACGPFARTSASGCEDIDECAEGTSGCDANATCTNVSNAAARCACKPGFEGDGQTCADDLVLVTEEELGETIAWLHRTTGMVVEGAGAVTVAALRHGYLPTPSGPVVAVVSGRNIDPSRLAQLTARFTG